MHAIFVELPAFARFRDRHLDDAALMALERELMRHPTAGNSIEGTGGLRKLRFPDARRGKGKRGGLRVIYFWWAIGRQFWLFTVYDKDEADDLATAERRRLWAMIKAELKARKVP